MNSKIKNFKDLKIWQKGIELVKDIYQLTDSFPSKEIYGIVSQMRRAAASICTNLLEGSHRLSRKEFRQFTGVAKGSAGELKYHILLAKDLGYLKKAEHHTLIKEIEQISMMLSGLVKSLTDTKH